MKNQFIEKEYFIETNFLGGLYLPVAFMVEDLWDLECEELELILTDISDSLLKNADKIAFYVTNRQSLVMKFYVVIHLMDMKQPGYIKEYNTFNKWECRPLDIQRIYEDCYNSILVKVAIEEKLNSNKSIKEMTIQELLDKKISSKELMI